MRRIIFRDEINFVFSNNNVNEDIRSQILEILFDNPFILGKQYILKDYIEDLNKVGDLLKKKRIKKRIISAINKILYIDEDLKLLS